MALVERARFLDALETSLADAGARRGRVVPIRGEAGIGKTFLLRHFTDLHGDGARIWWGSCDPMFTPRPLGPFQSAGVDECISTGVLALYRRALTFADRLELAEQLGATEARRPHEMGARGLPRGPRAATRASPARLTKR